MRVREIVVEKLFGIFDHVIPLKMEEQITIIHGLNGYGKTILLRMLSGLFNREYEVLHTIPYHRFALTFDDGSRLSIEKSLEGMLQTDRGQRSDDQRFTIIYTKPDGRQEEPFTWRPIDLLSRLSLEPGLRRHIMETLPVEPIALDGLWRERDTGNVAPLDVWGERYEHMLSPDLRMFLGREPQWLRDIQKKLRVRLIRTQRLEAEQLGDLPRSKLAVERYSEDIAARIRSALARYAAKSQDLDRTFPLRLIDGSASPTFAADEVKRRLSALDDKRARLADLGFIDATEHQDIGRQSVEGPQLAVLGLYTNDVESKLSVFDELANKIELFTTIINNRFQYKRLTIRRDSGFVFTTDVGSNLSADALSSGEQHEIVLLYELLFEVEPTELILIDEPEISLHITWQNEFLRDLERVVKLAGFDVLLATHSPDIIGERWDLTVKLEGPKRKGTKNGASRAA